MYTKNETKHIGKSDSDFKEIWSVDLSTSENYMAPMFISIPENGNVMLVSSIDEKVSKVNIYLFE